MQGDISVVLWLALMFGATILVAIAFEIERALRTPPTPDPPDTGPPGDHMPLPPTESAIIRSELEAARSREIHAETKDRQIVYPMDENWY